MIDAEIDLFQTEIIPNRPSTTDQPPRGRSQSALYRLKGAKEQAKILDENYKRALSNLTKTQNSISKINRETQRMRVDFLKLYENKKMKLTNRQKVQNHQLETKQNLVRLSRQAKQRRLIDQLQLAATKNEEQDKNATRQEKNKLEKAKLEKERRSKSFEQQLSAREQCEKIRQQKSYLSFRNKKIEEILIMKGKLNYSQKVQREMQIIKQYEQLLGEIGGVQAARPSTSMSRNFFVTTQKLDSQPCGGRDTSHTTRTGRP